MSIKIEEQSRLIAAKATFNLTQIHNRDALRQRGRRCVDQLIHHLSSIGSLRRVLTAGSGQWWLYTALSFFLQQRLDAWITIDHRGFILKETTGIGGGPIRRVEIATEHA